MNIEKQVASDIAEAIEDVREVSPELAQHLIKYIKIENGVCSYNPPEGVFWLELQKGTESLAEK